MVKPKLAIDGLSVVVLSAAIIREHQEINEDIFFAG
jgi:hypothetical protein